MSKAAGPAIALWPSVFRPGAARLTQTRSQSQLGGIASGRVFLGRNSPFGLRLNLFKAQLNTLQKKHGAVINQRGLSPSVR